MKRQSRIGLTKLVVLAAAAAAFLFLSPAARESVVTTARAAERVLVVNKENRPVPVTPAQELFQTRVQINIADNLTAASGSFEVPAGTRLVLENLGGKGAAQGINFVEVGQDGGSAFMSPTSVGIPGLWHWIGTTPTKVVFSAGNVSVTILRPAAQSGCTGCSRANYITLTGYLIPD